MGRALNSLRSNRLIIELKKITYPDGRRMTRSLVPLDIEGMSYNPDTATINEVIPKVDEYYHLLVDRFKQEGTPDALDDFLKKVSDIAVISGGLQRNLADDTGESLEAVDKALLDTEWLRSALEYIRSEYRKLQKSDPIKYAETIRTITDMFGIRRATYLLRKKGIQMKKSTITALRRIAGDTPTIKALINQGRLKLTVAFELPNTGEERREEIARQLSSADTYDEQMKLLRSLKKT
jgi:hypothetical protein